MSLFLRLSRISFGQYCQKNIAEPSADYGACDGK